MKTAIEPTSAKPKTAPRPRKPSLALHTPRKKPDYVDRMRSIAHRLLRKLELELIKKLPDDLEKIEAREKKFHLTFGARSTHLSALTSLADLLFKLDQADRNKSTAAAAAAPPQDIPMDPADIALVDHFVQRMKNPPGETV